MRKLTLAACSHYVFTAFPYENLKEKGFSISFESNQEYEGVIKQSLFIPSLSPLRSPSPTFSPSPLQSPPTSLSKSSLPVELNFLEITDEEEFMNSVKKQMKKQNSSPRGREILRPSLHFWGEEEADYFEMIGSIPVEIHSIQKKMEFLGTTFGPKNETNHPNSVNSVWGIYLGLSATEKEQWSQFLGRSLNDDNQWVLDDGIRIQCAVPGDGLYDYMESRKDFSFWAVVLQAQSFDQVEKQFEFDKSFIWQGTKSTSAVLIKEHLTNWDIIII